MQSRSPRGRVGPEPRAPNSEPVWLPEKPKKLIFGKTVKCPVCQFKGKKNGRICGHCGGHGVIDE